MCSEINIDINDIEYLPDGKAHYVFWRGILIGSIVKEKRTKYTPPELIGKWECGYTSNDYYDTKELAAIARVKKYLKRQPDRINGPKDDDLVEAEKFKAGIEYLQRIRAGDYGPENNIVRDDFKKWCIDNNVGDEKFQSKLLKSYMAFILSTGAWILSKDEDTGEWIAATENLRYCQYVNNIALNFLKHLILKGVSIRTFRQHSGNLAMLGEDVIKKRKSANFKASEFKEIFLHDIEKSSENPPDYGYIDKEGRSKRYRSTCKKLISYLEK